MFYFHFIVILVFEFSLYPLFFEILYLVQWKHMFQGRQPWIQKTCPWLQALWIMAIDSSLRSLIKQYSRPTPQHFVEDAKKTTNSWRWNCMHAIGAMQKFKCKMITQCIELSILIECIKMVLYEFWLSFIKTNMSIFS